MKATISHLNAEGSQVIEFGEYTRIKFNFGDENMRFIEISVGETLAGIPCLDVRSGWNGLIIEPIVSNALKLRMSDR